MKRYFLAVLLLTATPAIAANFNGVTPIKANGVVVRWEYDFSFKRSSVAAPEIVHLFENSCDNPVVKSTGRTLLPKAAECYKTEAEARVAVQKQADKFEKNASLLPLNN